MGQVKGYKQTEEHKRNSSIARCKFLDSDKGKENLAAVSERMKGNIYWSGRHHTEETKERIRNALLGTPLTDERKAKISEGNKFYYQSLSKKQRRKP